MKHKLSLLVLPLLFNFSFARAQIVDENPNPFAVLAILEMALTEELSSAETSSQELMARFENQDGVIAENPNLAKQSFEQIERHFGTVTPQSLETMKKILEHKKLGSIDEITEKANIHDLPLESVHNAIREVLGIE